MLVACRLADLSALEGHYAGVSVCAQFGGACGCAGRFFWLSTNGAAHRFPRDAGHPALARSLEASGRRGFRWRSPKPTPAAGGTYRDASARVPGARHRPMGIT